MSIFAISAYGSKKTSNPNAFKEMQHMVFGLQKQLNAFDNRPHKAFAFVDLTSNSEKTNTNTIVNWHNSLDRDLDVMISIGFENTDQPSNQRASVKVLYVAQYDLAGKLATAIAGGCGLVNGGTEQRQDLTLLTAANGPAVLIRIHDPQGVAHFGDIFTSVLRSIAAALAAHAPGQLEMPLDSSAQISPSAPPTAGVA
jgi:hypothetical protein